MSIKELPPLGNNNLSNPSLFEQRKFYKNRIFRNSALPTPLDTLYEKPFYGKVDIYGNLVYPSEAYLKQLSGGGFKTALNFVVDAFTDFQSFMHSRMNGKITTVSEIFESFTPTTASSNIHNLYHDHWEDIIFDLFINKYLTYPKTKLKIKTFKDFIEQFVNFCDVIVTDFPITKAAFVSSSLCPNDISGLFIGFENKNFGNDTVNYEEFISKDGFKIYAQAAANYGFYVNKNAPWQLIMNLDSPKAEEYMIPYGISAADNSLFSTYFYKVELFDYESLKRYLYNSYRIFLLGGNEYYEENKVCNYIASLRRDVSSNKYKTTSTTIAREIISDDYKEFEKNHDEKIFLEAYYRIRFREAGIKISERKMKSDLKKMAGYQKVFGIKGALAHIATLTKQTKIYEKPPIDEKPPYKIRYFGKKTISGLHAHSVYGNIDNGKKNGASPTMSETTEY